MKRFIPIVMVLACAVGHAQSLLSGSVVNPDGSGFNGRLIFSLAQNASASTVSPCTGPKLVVPTEQVTVTVTAGALVSPPTLTSSACTIPVGVPYNVIAIDSNGNVDFTDQWLISGTPFNVGTAVSSGNAPTVSYKGMWASTTTYTVGDIVGYGTSPVYTYVSTQSNNIGNIPGIGTIWQLLTGGGGGSSGFPIVLGTTTIGAGTTTTALTGISINGVTLSALGLSTTFLNGAGGYTTPSVPASSITVGTTTITGGTPGDIEYNNGGVFGEKGVYGSGSVLLGSGAVGSAAYQATSYFEPALGNPGTNGWVLSSTTAGVRSWIAPTAAPTGTGFVHVTSGVVDSGAAQVNLGYADTYGVLLAAQGGSGNAGTVTGVLYGNGTSAFTQATGLQIATAIGSNPVQNASNVQCYGAGCPNNNQWQAPWTYTGEVWLATGYPLGSGDTSMVINSVSGMPSAGAVITTGEEEIIYSSLSVNVPYGGLTTLNALQRGVHGTTPAAVAVAQGNMEGVVSETAACSTCAVIRQETNIGTTALNMQANPGLGGTLSTTGSVLFFPNGGTTAYITLKPNVVLQLPYTSAACLGTDSGGSVIVTTCTGGSTGAALTMNNSGSGAASGTAFNGATAYTLSYNTIGASPLAGSSSLTTVGTLSAGSIPYSLLTGTPTVGTWGALNYPTWTTGTPFVKMTAAGTFALDTNTYLTSSGVSGMTAGQVPIAATATTVTSSKALAGSGSGITTGPTSSTSGDLMSFTGTGGQAADSGIAASNVALLNAANTFTATNTFNNATYSALFTGGPVGIGTTGPSYPLDVNGTARAEGFIVGGGGGYYGAGSIYSDSNWGMLFRSVDGGTVGTNYSAFAFHNSADTPLVNITNSGNVSIGDTTATSMFNVGTANQFQVTSAGIVTIPIYAIASLPSAATSGAGAHVIVSDALTYTPGTCTNGGSDYMIAVSNGTTWSCH